MPVTSTHLTTGTDTANVSPYVTASITPTAGRLILAAVFLSYTTSATPTLTGNGLTWTLVATTTTATARELSVFRAMGAAPTAGSVTIATTGTSPTGCLWTITEFAGADTSGTNGSGGIVGTNIVNARPASATSISQAYPSAITAGNQTFAAIGGTLAQTVTPGAGWSSLGQINGATPAQNLIGMNGTNGVGLSPVTASWATATSTWVIGVEIVAAAAAAAARPQQVRMQRQAVNRAAYY